MSRSDKTTPYDPRTLLTHRLLVLSNTLGKGAVRLYAGRYSVPVAEWRLLSALCATEPATINGLAAVLGTDKGWISRTTAALVDKGLAMTADHSDDARRFYITTTAAGRALFERVLPAAVRRHRQLVSVFSTRELATLDALLLRLQRQAELLAEGIGIADLVPGPAAPKAGRAPRSKGAVSAARGENAQTGRASSRSPRRSPD